jgi:hypothetical protein
MKKLLFLVLLISSFLLSCKKEKTPSEPVLVAKLNGVDWYSTRQSIYPFTDGSGLVGIIFEHVLPNGEEGEVLIFTALYPEVGNKEVIKTRSERFSRDTCASFFNSILGGDAVLAHYELDEKDPNRFLIIDSFDAETGRMTGRFQVSYSSDYIDHLSWLPEKLEFKEGKFDLVIDK